MAIQQRLHKIAAKVDALWALQGETAAELEALLPAVLAGRFEAACERHQ